MTSPTPTPTDDRHRLTLRVVAMPKDTNQYGTIFGGVILSYIDQAGFVEARRHGCHRWVTASMDKVDFKAPINVGDTVSFYASTTRLGTKSVGVTIDVIAERFASAQSVHVTNASMTLVSVDRNGTPIPFRSPATVEEPGVNAG
ncbi:MAG: hotdog domain-containing protein [Planctomycetota bacterium]